MRMRDMKMESVFDLNEALESGFYYVAEDELEENDFECLSEYENILKLLDELDDSYMIEYVNECEDEFELENIDKTDDVRRFEVLMRLVDLCRDDIDIDFNVDDLYYYDDYDKYDFMQSDEAKEFIHRLKMLKGLD